MASKVARLVREVVGENVGCEGVAVWVAAVKSWNARMDMTAARSDGELVDLMVADAAQLAKRLPQGASVVDVGTGAGAPGLPLAMLREDLQVTLVEPMQKRAALLRLSAAKMRDRVTVEQCRGEALVGARSFDVALSRATLPPQQWLELGAKLAPDVWLLLAREQPPELGNWRSFDDATYRWPLTGASRRLVGMRCD